VRIPRFTAHIDWANGWEAAAGTRLIHPVRFEEDGPAADGWSLIVTLMEPVTRSDTRSRATVHFLVPAAPHHHLRPGRPIEYRMGGTLIGHVLVGEPDGFIDADA
jgi:hypothetical protein